MTPDTVARMATDVVFSNVDGEAVLLSGRRGVYYGLDAVGTRIWTLVREHGRLGDVHRRLVAEYDAPADRLWNDLERLIAELRDRDLVSIDEPSV